MGRAGLIREESLTLDGVEKPALQTPAIAQGQRTGVQTPTLTDKAGVLCMPITWCGKKRRIIRTQWLLAWKSQAQFRERPSSKGIGREYERKICDTSAPLHPYIYEHSTTSIRDIEEEDKY